MYPLHSRLHLDNEHTCAVKDCLRVFENGSKLQQHASKTGHRAFQCLCDKAYTKLCSLTRHIKEAVEKPQHKCPLFVSDCKAPRWNLRCYSSHLDNKVYARISHLEAHLVKIHKKTPDEIEALVRPLRKNKSSKGGFPADVARAVTTTALGNDAGTFLSAPSAVSQPVGDYRLSGTNPAGVLLNTITASQSGVTTTTAGISIGDQAGYQLAQSSSVDAIRSTGLPQLSTGAQSMSAASWLNGDGRVDLIAAGAGAGPTCVPTTGQNMLDYENMAFVANDQNTYAIATADGIPSNTAIQHTSFSGYYQSYLDNMNAQQGGLSALSAGVVPWHQLQHPAAPGGAFVGIPQASLLGYGQTTTLDDAIGQQGMSFGSAAPAAGYPSHPAAYPPALGGALAANQPYQSVGFGNYGQLGHGAGAGGAQQNAFSGPEGGYLTPNPNGLRTIAPNNFNFDMGTAGSAHVGAGSIAQNMALGLSNTASGEDISGLTNGDNMVDSSSFDGTNFGNAGW